MAALVVVHVAVALVLPWLVARFGRRVIPLGALPGAATFVWALAQYRLIVDGGVRSQTWRWIPSLDLDLAFRMDALSWWLVLVVSGIGCAVLVFCAWYFADDEPGLGRFVAFLTAFAGAMLGLVTADDIFLMVVFWEVTTVLSYLLVGHRSSASASRAAATQALVVTTFGGLALLVGVVILRAEAGTSRFSVLLANPPTGPLLPLATVLILVGALSKSALVPFHFWLPGAMAAPTPASAYLHAAAMVKAGIYLVARTSPFLGTQPTWRPVVIAAGSLTMLIGGWRALRQFDLKLILAYGTVSQLGLLTLLAGDGSADVELAAVVMLVAHALFKAALFLVVGVIDHATGTRDIRELHGLWKKMPVLGVIAVAALVSMSGLPPTLGFVAKEAALDGLWFSTRGGDRLVLAAIVAGSAFTVAYSARFFLGAFPQRQGRPDVAVHRPGWLGMGPPALLAAAGVAVSFLSAALEAAILPYAEFWPADAHPVHLGLWHGLTPALGMSGVAVLVGVLLVVVRNRVEAVQARLGLVPGADRVYRALMTGLGRLAVEVTGGLQRGSLPVTLALILGVLVVLPGGSMLLTGNWEVGTRLWDSPAQVAVLVVLAVAALAATRSRRRLRAAILVGVTGYATAFLFLLHGAPDVAFTQVLAETVSLVIVVLVQRRLPIRFTDHPPGLSRLWRWAVALPVGGVMMLLAFTAAGARPPGLPPASVDFEQQAQAFGGGKNVVNVTLVDIRAWDTMGELSVVLATAVGVASLVFLRQRNLVMARRRVETVRQRRVDHRALAESTGSGTARFLAESGQITSGSRSVIFEVVTRMGFHFMIMYSLYLLFSGHNQPGGGFAAGLVVGLALTIRYLAGGRAELAAAMPVMPGWLLGAGLALAVVAGLAPLAFGGMALQSYIFDIPIPLVGKAHLVTSVFFDIGVYLVVIGLMLDILRSLGGGLDIFMEQEQDILAEKEAAT